jgi:hypothetical protein
MRKIGCDPFEGLLPIAGRHDLEASSTEPQLGDSQDMRFIVYDQYFVRH